MKNDSETLRYAKKFKTVLDKKMAYIDKGEGDPIVFLHGNPTSSYLWRNIMPYMQGQGRLIAIDMIGLGDSQKLDNTHDGSYSLAENSKYTFALLDALGVNNNVTLVLHDWGSGVGFNWANTHRDAVKAIAFMEAIVTDFPTWDDFPKDLHGPIGTLRSAEGEKMVLDDNFFIETILPATITRQLTRKEHDEYRRPFINSGEERRAILAGPRQLPIAGEPADTVALVKNYASYLANSHDIPKLFINAEPGAFLVGYARDFVRTWPNLTEVTVSGIHYIQEDSAHEIGKAISDWLSK
ncbi:haloalkane dehalogenase [Pseudoalteromonas sp. SG45-5]|uniref:haloalkane dehalogenase n=1 Tax=unclassified Pseudoalteromonas TaxID=194690 RepID=UPI0015FB37CB|nr:MULTISPECIES: haloalkane dehalogenase [unclassified Pseudoalteromonas]MBB1386552.1 haloalkane dehalogenase [Pseudoalteromonas sp. SG45-5]MBB1394547.1 haloalkane dehalogenase [Pseudoalteromonas sp. SG44-4]MBB1448879.1 haloalkane dehalogenase [Pseudoalteromonas sp. SG41-6]